MLVSRLRKPVDTFAPSLGYLYRMLRDVGVAHRSRETGYSFKIAGEPRIAADGFEPYEVKLFIELLKGHDAVVDVGANIGFYTCLAASRGKPVICFEPSPRNLQFLYRNLWENGFRDLEVFPLGLARHPGLQHLYGFSDMASFVSGWAQSDGKRFALVPVTSLDRAMAGKFAGKRLLIKMDVEGFELDVLGGAAETLSLDPRPTWIVEILLRDGVIPGGTNSRFRETFEVFWKHGYQCRKIDKRPTQVQNADVEQWIGCGSADCKNFLFSST